MQHALAVAAPCCLGSVQASCIQKHAALVADLRQLPLAGIAPEGAHGPERAGGVDPCGLGGFLRLGLHVWVDLGGRGRKLSACHGSLPPERYLQLRAGNMFPPPGVTADSETDAAGKPHPRLTGATRRRRESSSLPAASQVPFRHSEGSTCLTPADREILHS
ncbi:hypothetical protein PBY51_003730 [Eleginops maclovinus]|uniref:Uncharacterized protein n=1 Tax=Eleginops maclovinus TaxID=56733 RepID=A0AAN7Y1N7_ELEMC|nr:hypothetical protein PBY51_003730 [Eleginops maclovinus]